MSNLRKPLQWERRIWEALVEYVNSGGVQDFEQLVSVAMDWIGGDIDDSQNCDDVIAGASWEVMADRYRPELQNLLTWLSDPVRHRELAYDSGEILRRHGTDIVMHWAGLKEFDPSDDALISEWPERCGSVITPVCIFIKDQIDSHDLRRARLRDVIPICLCDRPGCGRFRVLKIVRAADRMFCSGLCRAKLQQSTKTKAEKAEVMRVFRNVRDRHKAKPLVKGPAKKAGKRKR